MFPHANSIVNLCKTNFSFSAAESSSYRSRDVTGLWRQCSSETAPR